MAAARGPSRRDARPTAKTPAERAEEAAAVQRRLKQEAAEPRQVAAASKNPPTGPRDNRPT